MAKSYQKTTLQMLTERRVGTACPEKGEKIKFHKVQLGRTFGQ